MKPASVIFLIVSVVLVLCGFILCRVASSRAEKENVSLYTNSAVDTEEGEVRTYLIDDSTADKLMLDIKDVPVAIHKSPDHSSYLELLNFSVGAFDKTETNNVLTFSNNSRLLSLFSDLKAGNFNFKGLRDLLAMADTSDGEQRVDLYLAEDSDIRNLNVLLDGADLTVEDVTNTCDYHITVTGGNIAFRGVSTSSLIEVEQESGTCTLQNTSASIAIVKLKQGDLQGNAFCVGTLTADISGGSAVLSLARSHEDCWLDLYAEGGQILVDGNEMPSPYSEIPEEYEQYLALFENEETEETGEESKEEEIPEELADFKPLEILSVRATGGGVAVSFETEKEQSGS